MPPDSQKPYEQQRRKPKETVATARCLHERDGPTQSLVFEVPSPRKPARTEGMRLNTALMTCSESKPVRH